MADQRITQLTQLSKAGVAATDVLPIVDLSASETKKVTAKDLIAAGIDLVDNSEIDLAKLDQSSTTKIGTTALADGAVTYAKLQNVSATDRLLGRSTAGSGNVEEISCTPQGRALLDDATAADQRTTLGLGSIATQSASSVAITGGTITGGTISGITDLAVADGGTGASTAADARTNLGLAIGTNVQAYDPGLQSISGLTTAADQTIYTTGSDTYAVTGLTAAGRALLDDATAADQRTTLGLGSMAVQAASNVTITGGSAILNTATITSATINGGTVSGISDLAVADGGTGASNAADARTNLGLSIGTNVQAYDAGLQSIAGLTTAANQAIYTTGVDTYAVTGLTAAGRALLDDASATEQRSTLGLGTLATLSEINTSELVDDAVTAAKLANESTVDLVTDLPVSGAFTGQFALVTSTKKLYCWTGAVWETVKAAGSVNTLVADNAGVIDLTITSDGDQVTIAAAHENTAEANQFLAGPTNAGGTVGYRTISAVDLPLATDSARGAVQVNGEGLRMDGSVIEINNDVTASPSAVHVVTYDEKGLITGGRQLETGDLPIAASGINGAVQPGTGLDVTIAGVLNHSNVVAPATATKVSYDAQGHITSSQSLVADDIPSLDAAKITSGSFGTERITDGSITAAKIADSGLTKVSGAGQFPQPDFLGQFLYSATGILYFAVGTSLSEYMWMPVNDQTSLNKQVRWGGTWNADTGKIATVTSFATQAGLAVDQDLPAPDENGVPGLYFICTTAGTGSGYAPAVPFDVGDWVLSLGTTWLRIDVITGGTGTLNAEQILLNPAVGSYVACQDAIAGLYDLTQIATDSTLGVIRGSDSITVDSVSGAASVDVIDEGTY